MRNGSFSWQILASAIRHGGSSGPDVAGMGLILEVNGLLRCDTTEALNSFTVVVKVWVFVGSSFFVLRSMGSHRYEVCDFACDL